MVIGFVGGFVKHDARAHSTVQVVEHLRNEYREGVYVQSFANRHRDQAYKEIRRRLDGDNDGTLSAEEKQKARIVIFGHSWGASETVALARQAGARRYSRPAHHSGGQRRQARAERFGDSRPTSDRRSISTNRTESSTGVPRSGPPTLYTPKFWETFATTTGRIPSVARDIRGSTGSW